jgi:hypothetical protein
MGIRPDAATAARDLGVLASLRETNGHFASSGPHPRGIRAGGGY